MNRFTLIVASVISLFIIEGAIVGAVLVSPDARDGLGRFAEDVVVLWAGSDERPGLLSRFVDEADQSIDRWVLPVWQQPTAEAAVPSEFSECADCHENYWTNVRSSDLYFNHPTHAEAGLTCEACHTDLTHPNPLAPPERVCAECHTQVASESQCQYCHVPGSLPHYYDFAIPRGGYVDCGTCHLPDSFHPGQDHSLILPGSFDGTDRDSCTACHSASTCANCHDINHPDGWNATHGADVDEGGANNCGTCHTATYCSDACHAGVRPRSRPLPIGGTSG
ncbi:MAG: hypothetical protein P1T08_04390 [Acidimicrobiia bacterium]|nr:hypothetical protein [Acidimicrobiia bacterium]